MQVLPLALLTVIVTVAALRLEGIVFTQVPSAYAVGTIVLSVLFLVLAACEAAWLRMTGRSKDEKTVFGRIADMLQIFPWQ